MLRIALISLLSVFLMSNHVYATIPTNNIYQAIKKAQAGELTQDDMQQLYSDIVSSIDSNDLEQILASSFSINNSIQQEEPPLCVFLTLLILLGAFVGYVLPFLIPYYSIPYLFVSLFYLFIC